MLAKRSGEHRYRQTISHFRQLAQRRSEDPRLDGRLRIIAPTEKGKREFARLNENSNVLISHLIEKLTEEECEDLLSKMEGIRAMLERAK
jgi:DNA-binding MarR family transcriptional regulator